MLRLRPAKTTTSTMRKDNCEHAIPSPACNHLVCVCSLFILKRAASITLMACLFAWLNACVATGIILSEERVRDVDCMHVKFVFRFINFWRFSLAFYVILWLHSFFTKNFVEGNFNFISIIIVSHQPCENPKRLSFRRDAKLNPTLLKDVSWAFQFDQVVWRQWTSFLA